MWFLRLVPVKTNFPFVKFHIPAILASLIAIVAGFALVFVNGLNFGIDFAGGTLVEIQTEGPADLGKIRSVVGALDLGDVAVQEFGAPTDVLLRVEAQRVSAEALAADPQAAEKAQQAAVGRIRAALLQGLGQTFEIRRVEVVGPKVAGELVQQSAIAVIIAVLFMMAYIWFRFEWQFSVGALLALVHDVSLTLAVFSITRMEFNFPIIAALLLIIGYSMNDTVVVFDRIRENLRKFKKLPLHDLIDLSVNETLSRTTVTAMTTLVALLGLYFFGPEVIKGFVFAMMFGIVVGTYSSIFIASPVLLYTGVKRDWSSIGAKEAERGRAQKEAAEEPS